MWFCLLQRKKCGSPLGISPDFLVENHTDAVLGYINIPPDYQVIILALNGEDLVCSN